VIELEGKVVLVTGGAGGIGAAFVRTMVQAGGETVLHDVVTTGGAMDPQRELGAAAAISSPGTWPTGRQWTRSGARRSRGGVASTF
jgi:NAD(P)-dependent dehydrogenase (short-subunit alcohol dehydrogenase family)